MSRDRRLLLALLERLESTHALSLPAEHLTVAVDDVLKENR
jgi:hypothetical protein